MEWRMAVDFGKVLMTMHAVAVVLLQHHQAVNPLQRVVVEPFCRYWPNSQLQIFIIKIIKALKVKKRLVKRTEEDWVRYWE
mmetsp:Transcript_2987/g.4569  ORF Transcript_2987/g.4569 Transcript_2987/m.4569 type:complete len:81 (+) Transcript_2987:210-452(+)